MKRVLDRLAAGADGVAVALFTAMFACFIIQIVSRYVLNDPYSWTIEGSLIAWLWIVFWCGAFLLNNRDHVRFDMLYAWVRPGVRKVFALISVVAIIAAFAVSLPATVDYVTFMKVERSGTLGIRFDLLFAIYPVFAVAIIVRYVTYGVKIARGGDPDAVMNRDSGVGTAL